VRIVLDSGILIRANDSKTGLGRDLLLTLLRAKHTLLVSNAILFEVAKVLRYPRLQEKGALTENDIYQYIAFLREVGEVVPLDPTIPVPIRDANDIVVAQTAILGEAEFLCTIDDDFYEPVIMQFLQRFGIAVISDEDLIHRIRS